MRVLRLTLPVALLVAVFGAFAPVQAQTGSVTGTVRDAGTGQPLTGVQMVIVGTNSGALTNAEGRYLITGVPTGDREVRAILIGYSQQTQAVEVSTGAPAVADFQLATSVIDIDGLVVNAATGREQRARELGTNVANINLEEVNPGPINSVADALSGRTSGLQLQDVNGSVGTSQRIRIRGANSLSLSNEPLVFVDGIQISSGTGSLGVGGQQASRLNDINPADIANIEVIKGPAAAALYGTAAANGVIQITTKRGRPGDTQWEFYAEAGEMEDITEYPANFAAYQIDDPSQPIFTSSGFLNGSAISLCSNRAAAAGVCTQDGVSSFNTMEDPRTAPYSTGTRQMYGVSVRGGNESVRYFVSGQLQDEAGIINFNTNEQLNLRANVDAALNENFDLSLSVGYADGALALNSNDNSIFSPILNGILGYPNFIPGPEAGQPSASNYGFGFPLRDLETYVINQEIDRLTASSTANWRPTEWLTINATGGLDFTSRHDFRTLQAGDLPIGGTFTLGFRESDRRNNYVYSGRTAAIGSFQLTDELTSTTTVGGSFEQTTGVGTECFGATLVLGTASCGTTATNFSLDEDFFEIRTVGGYVQQEFGWRDRVFVAASVRGDDNSAFGSDFGFVYYPSASLSWVVGEEDFFPQTDVISGLRVRAAYGESGLRPGFRDAVTLFSPVTVAVPTGGNDAGVILSSTGNTTLKPEIATEVEFGFDTGLFNDRLAVDFTYFQKTSEDALVSRRLPGSLGLTTTVFENLGEIENSGTELTLNLDVYQSDMVGLNVGFTNTSLSNEVKDLGEGVDPIIFNRGLQRHEEGFSAGGFWQQPYTFDDADGNGKLSNSEVTISGESEFIGPSLPEWNRSVFADLRISNWITVSTLFEGVGGHYRGNDSEAFRCGFRSTRGCAAVGNPDASLEEQARYIADRFLATASGYVEQADFWRWRELSIAFDAPAALTETLPQLDGLRLTLSGRNLATFTDYTGLDPETNEGGGNANFSNSEFNTQPPVRSLMLRLDYRF
ncbi:MAG TPA: SusC/RagA family TonB-linked outer membrane protein [Longimicrobiales bacterium]|nr:SusC/RagA family TonB-linked outer membrane protein [Longimicrobiales bacterium]